MSKYIYPAIFKAENDGSFSVSFPDLSDCFTCGDDLMDAYDMAEDALALMLYHYEQEGMEINKPSAVEDIKHKADEFVSLVPCDTIEYQKLNNNDDNRTIRNSARKEKKIYPFC